MYSMDIILKHTFFPLQDQQAMTSSKYIRIAVMNGTSFFSLRRTPNGTLNIIGGTEALLLNLILQGLRMEPIVLVPEDNTWGDPLGNNTWSGLIGLVQRGEADLAMGGMLMDNDRAKAVEFSYPYVMYYIAFATKKPESLSASMQLVKPFNVDTWIAIAVTMVLLPVMFSLLLSKKHSVVEIFTDLYGYVCNQPLNIRMKKMRDRLLVGAWLFGTIFLSKIYITFLLSFMAMPIKQQGIKSISGLSKAVADGQFECYTVRGTSLLKRMSDTDNEEIKVITDAIKKNDWLLDASTEVFARYLSRKDCAIVATKFYFASSFQDEIFVCDDTFKSAHAALILPHKSPLRKKIDRLILRTSAFATYSKKLEHFLFKKHLQKNIRKKAEDISNVTLDDLKQCFLFLTYGHFLAFVTCILELIVGSLNEKKRTTMKQMLRKLLD